MSHHLSLYGTFDTLQVAILVEGIEPAWSVAVYDQSLVIDFRIPVRLLSREQDIDHLENLMPHSHNGSLVSPSDHKSFVEPLELALGLFGTVGRFAQKRAHVSVALPGSATFLFSGAFLVSRTHPQLKRIEDLWQRRDTLWKLYEEELGSLVGVRLLKTLPDIKHARHLFTILVPPEKRDSLLWVLQDRGIGVAVNYRPIHLLKYYKETFGYREGDYPVAEEIGKSTISLPLYPSLNEEDLKYTVKILEEEIVG